MPDLKEFLSIKCNYNEHILDNIQMFYCYIAVIH